MKYTNMVMVIMLLVLPGCRATLPFTVSNPAGFAHFSKETVTHRAVSADGVRFLAYAAPAREFEDVMVPEKLWMEEADLWLKSRGYVLLKQEDVVTAAGLKGRYNEYSVAFNAEDYVYAVAIFTHLEKVFVVESGGRKAEFDNKRAAIKQSIATLAAVE